MNNYVDYDFILLLCVRDECNERAFLVLKLVSMIICLMNTEQIFGPELNIFVIDRFMAR